MQVPYDRASAEDAGMTVTQDIMDRLKAETAELHDEAEHHLFQSRLVKGRLAHEVTAPML